MKPILVMIVAAAVCWGQGMASRGIKPMPRGKPSGLPFHAKFTDVAEKVGLRSPVVYGGVEVKDYIVETMGSGAAFFDYDADGWVDVFVLSGTVRNSPPKHAISRLYRNGGDGTFKDVTHSSGLDRQGWASGVAVGDYDNDEREDLFVTYWGTNVLYRNKGGGRFIDVTAEAGLLGDGNRWGSGCTFIDYDRDGDLDLFVANYLKFDFETTPSKGSGVYCEWKGVAVNCGPRGLPTEFHSLYRNEGDGTFSDVSEESGIRAVPGTYGLTAIGADFDLDGWPDIYVACDGNPSLLFMNNGDGTFSEEGLLRGVALSDDGLEQAGMGVAVGDYDTDGDLDIFKTHFVDDTNVLYRNDGSGEFDDMTIAAGIAVETRFVNWGAGIVDLDNNGLPDIFYVTGGVYPEVGAKLPAYAYETPRVIFRNLGDGRFEELLGQGGPGISTMRCSRGTSFADYDNDGDLDILVVNLNAAPSLLRNDLDAEHNWLQVKLVGEASNRSAIGALVTARYGEHSQMQAVLSQSSYLSSSGRRLHFGLGSAGKVDLEVRWPDGLIESFDGLTAGRLVTIHEGSGLVETADSR